MIDVCRTTLVPSFAALCEFRQRGELNRLVEEVTAERMAVASALSRDPRDITVELTPRALSVAADKLTAAVRDPRVKQQLIRQHTIHPLVAPRPQHRFLNAGTVGISRHDEHIWLWASDAASDNSIQTILHSAAVTPHHPSDRDWPVSDAYVLVATQWRGTIHDMLTQRHQCVDVDTNGRPFP